MLHTFSQMAEKYFRVPTFYFIDFPDRAHSVPREATVVTMKYSILKNNIALYRILEKHTVVCLHYLFICYKTSLSHY